MMVLCTYQSSERLCAGGGDNLGSRRGTALVWYAGPSTSKKLPTSGW